MLYQKKKSQHFLKINFIIMAFKILKLHHLFNIGFQVLKEVNVVLLNLSRKICSIVYSLKRWKR